ncbi:MAG: Nramp family divalent metal transporter [Acidobacteriia bacterium]|nr:Nramp family divalent metal transporter [Terriglobia bacterium]
MSDPQIPRPSAVTEASPERGKNVPPKQGLVRAIGLGLITGAADDDPSAIGTYASAGAKFGPALLWMAPVTFPMMFAVVYLSAKLGQVAGEGLFAVLRKNYSRKVLFPTLIGVLIGNTIEAGADLGGIAAALNLLVPIPILILVPILGVGIVCLQTWGSYKTMRNIFRVLALTLLAYIPAAILARPDWPSVLRGTIIPTIQFDRDSLAMVVAVIGTTLSAYLYTWQSNEEVEEEKESGRVLLSQRRGATEEELRHSQRDVLFGMLFSNVAMYFIILATAATLFKAGKTDIDTAAQAAQSLAPLAGNAAKILFALGVIGVGFLAVPVMTGGAAYDLCQSIGWKYGLGKKPAQAKRFYIAIAGFSIVGMAINFLGINPMKALVFAGIVQGFSTPPLMLLIMLVTNNRTVMGDKANSRAMNVLGWITTVTIFAAAIALLVTWII